MIGMTDKYKIEVHRLVPHESGAQYADDRVPLLEMLTEFPDLAATNLRMLADRLDREGPDSSGSRMMAEGA